MTMTEPLFLTDPRLKEFEAEVVSTKREKDCLLVELDRTAFHPQGAGQASDAGEMLGGSGSGNVAEVIEMNGLILHRVTGLENVSGTVKCRIDWPRRQRLASLHTGEHLLMASLVKLDLGLELDKIQIDENGGKLFVNGAVSLKDIAEAEKTANSVIGEARPVKTRFFENVDDARQEFQHLRIKEEKISRRLRVVEVEGFDASACSGTHVANTGEVGCVKAVWLNNAGGGKSIIHFETGRNAVERMFALSNVALEVSGVLGAEPHKAATAASNLKARAKTLYDVLRKVGKIASSSVKIEPVKIGDAHLYSADLTGMSNKDDVSKTAKRLLAADPKGVVVLVGGFDEPFFVLCARGTQTAVDVGGLASEVCGILGGGSGGKPDFATGSGRNGERIGDALLAAGKRLAATT